MNFSEEQLKIINEGNLEELLNLFSEVYRYMGYKFNFVQIMFIKNRTDFFLEFVEDNAKSEFFMKHYFPELFHLSLRGGNLQILEKYLEQQVPSLNAEIIESDQIKQLKHRLNKIPKYYILHSPKEYLNGMYQPEDSETRIKILEIFIKLSIDIDTASKFNKDTALQLAAQCRQLKDIEFLIKNGANVHLKNLEKKSSFYFAYESGISEKFITIYLKYGGNLHTEDEDGCTPFTIAILYNSPGTVNFILKHGYNINHKDKNNSSALHFASMKKYKFLDPKLEKSNIKEQIEDKIINLDCDDSVKLFKMLLDNSECNIYDQNNEGCTPFVIAVLNNSMEVANYILSLGYDINHQNKNGDTALHYACLELNENAADFLIKFGAKVNILNNNNEYPFNKLFVAAEKSKGKGLPLNLFEKLLKNGAFVNFANSLKNKPIYRTAIYIGNIDLMQLLIQYKADCDILRYNSEKCSLLYSIIKESYLNINFINEAVKLLVKNKANVDYIDNDGISILHKACIKKYLTIVKILLIKRPKTINQLIRCDSNWNGALPNFTSCFPGTQKKSVLDISVLNNDQNLFKVLLNKVEKSLIDQALLFSVLYCKTDMLQLFIENGIHVRNKVFNGIPIIHVALMTANHKINLSQERNYASADFTEIQKILNTLICYEVDFNAKDLNNKTPFSFAASLKNKDKLYRWLLPYIIFLFKQGKYFHESEKQLYKEVINPVMDQYDKEFNILKNYFIFKNISSAYIFENSIDTLANTLPNESQLLRKRFVDFITFKSLQFSDIVSLKLELVFEKKRIS